MGEKWNKREDAPPTKVLGVRLDESVWAKIEEVAEREGKTRNALIAKAIDFYLKDVEHRDLVITCLENGWIPPNKDIGENLC